MINIIGKSCCPESTSASSSELVPLVPTAEASSTDPQTRNIRLLARQSLAALDNQPHLIEAVKKVQAYEAFVQSTSKNAIAAKQALSEVHEILKETGSSVAATQKLTMSITVITGFLTIIERFATVELPKFLTDPKNYFLNFDGLDEGPDWLFPYYEGDSSTTTTTTSSLNQETDLKTLMSFVIHMSFIISSAITCYTALKSHLDGKSSKMLFHHFFSNLFGQTSVAGPNSQIRNRLTKSISKELRQKSSMELSRAKEHVDSIMFRFNDDFNRLLVDIVKPNLGQIEIELLGRAAIKEAKGNRQKATTLMLSWIIDHHDKSETEMVDLLISQDFNFSVEELPSFMQSDELETEVKIYELLREANEPTLVNWYKMMALGDQIIASDDPEKLKRFISSLKSAAENLKALSVDARIAQFLELDTLLTAIKNFKTKAETSDIRSWIKGLQDKGGQSFFSANSQGRSIWV